MSDKAGVYSPEYEACIKSPEFKKHFGENGALTNAQHQFAEWCLTQEEHLNVVGEMDKVFISIRSYLKHNNK